MISRCRVYLTVFLLLIISIPAAAQQGLEQSQALAYVQAAETERMVGIPMRDGVELNSRIYFPPGSRENLPTVLMRTPYFFPSREEGWAEEIATFLQNGYAVVFQNERGRYWSEGKFTYLVGARDDGYDTVEWLVDRPWSNGKVGTFGCSSSAEHQLGLATTDHPGHAAMIPMGAGAGIGTVGGYQEQGNFYRGGVWQTLWLSWYYSSGYKDFPTFRRELSREEKIRINRFYDLAAETPPVDMDEAVWGLPLMDLMDEVEGPPSDFYRFIKFLPNDPRWEQVNLVGDGDPWGVPSLWVNSWYDISMGPNMALYNYVRNGAGDRTVAENQFAIIAATAHCDQRSETKETVIGERNIGDARFDYLNLFVDWFDYWLKGEENGVTDRPEVQLYTMGKNEWQYFENWPPAETEEVPFYFGSDEGANSRLGDGRLVRGEPSSGDGDADEFVYDPGHPVPSVGGSVCCFSEDFQPGSFDQASVELRNDILIYTTPPLEEGVQVTGPVKVILHVSSDVPDTDFTAKLIDVYPDGRAYNLAESIQRARWREGFDEPVFMEEGNVYKVEVGPLLTSNFFPAGHRIRIEISSSNFPRFARNLNTGGNNYDEAEWQTAHSRVHHTLEHPSRIVLPIVDDSR